MSSVKKVEYEYCVWESEMSTTKATETWASAKLYTDVSARIHFWQEYQSVFLKFLQKNYYDEGWQPVTEVGPAMIEIELRPAGFLGNPPQRYVFTKVSVNLRRPK